MLRNTYDDTGLQGKVDNVSDDLGDKGVGNDTITRVQAIIDDLANGTDGLGALKALIDVLPTVMRGTDNAALVSDAGNFTSGRAVTATLRVSPNGDNSDGETWSTAYNEIQTALNAASTDVNALTLILIAPKTGNVHYDINTAGDPTWSANVILKGSHRTWVKIMNDNVGATSIMKLTGYASLNDLNFNLGESNNGVIFTKGAFRAGHLQFVGENLTGAITRTALHMDGASPIKHGKLSDIHFLGAGGTHMIAMLFDNCVRSEVSHIRAHQCLTGAQFVNSSDSNYLIDIDLGDCAVGLDIDSGDVQHFTNITFHDCALNVDDVTRNHVWMGIHGQFPVTVEPVTIPDYTGVVVSAGEDAYGSDTELRAAGTAKPFKILGYRFEPSEEKKFMIRFSANAGAPYFDMALIEVKKNKAQGASEGTDFIFNAGTRISASAGCEVAGKSVQIWLEIQEI